VSFSVALLLSLFDRIESRWKDCAHNSLDCGNNYGNLSLSLSLSLSFFECKRLPLIGLLIFCLQNSLADPPRVSTARFAALFLQLTARGIIFYQLSLSPAVSPFFLLDGKEDGRWRVNAVVNRRSASHKTQQITLRELF